MIQGEISLYKEPKPVICVSTTNTYDTSGYINSVITSAELQAELDKADRLGITIGSKYRYKSSGTLVVVVRKAEDLTKLIRLRGIPAVILCDRYNASGQKLSDFPAQFTVAELMDSELMEPVYENKSC